MDPLTKLMGRTALLYLASGFVLGAVLMIGEAQGASWYGAWTVTHAHILFVGWFVQFAVGIAFWLLPRRKTPKQPFGYNERLGYLAYGLVNIGIILRIIFEPLFRLGKLDEGLATVSMATSGILMASAGLIWASQLWGRFYRRYSSTNQPVKE
jgi:cbb3-type cytochrome oxidase subunit 1